MRLPRSQGPLKAVPGVYYYTAILRRLRDRMSGHCQVITLKPESIFKIEEITTYGPRMFARCTTHPHGVEFYVQISGQELLQGGYHKIGSPLVLLAMQAE